MPVPTSSVFSRARTFAAKRKRIAVVAIAATIALLAAGLTVGAASSASADPVVGNVTGTVSVENAQNPGEYDQVGADDVLVKAWLLSDDGTTATNTVDDQTSTFSDGSWGFDDTLAPGSYIFEYDYTGSLPNIANTFIGGDGSTFYTINDAVAAQASDSSIFTPIAEGNDQGMGNADLNLGNIITGNVSSGDTGEEIAGQTVTVYRDQADANGDGNYSMQQIGESLPTDARGNYTIDSLPTGTFTLSTGGSGGYATQYWNGENVTDPNQADTFDFDSLGGSNPYDFVLEKAATVGGTVKNTSGTAVSGIIVTAFASADDAINNIPVASVTTASNGTYSFTGLSSGNYVISFASPASATTQYLTQYYKGATTPDSAQYVSVDFGSNVTGINASLAKSAIITGTVTASGLSAGDFSIFACPAYDNGDGTFSASGCDNDSDDAVQGTVTNVATGAYTIGNIPSGSFAVHVDFTGPENYQSQYYPDSHNNFATGAVTTKAGTTTSGINLVLDAGATISGRVTTGGSPTAGITVNASPDGDGTDSSEGHDSVVRSATTGSDGNYTITGLGTGAYGLEETGTVAQWYPGVSSEYSAGTLNVTAGGSTDGVDFALVSPGQLSGTVVDGVSSQPLEGVNVYAKLFRSDTATISDQVESTSTDSTGSYSFNDLAPGSYSIEFAPDSQNTGYLPDYIGGSSTYHLTVASGSNQTINDGLHIGGSYTGIVQDALGNPIPDVPIYPIEPGDYDAYTGQNLSNEPIMSGSDGSFTINGLPTGTNTLAFEPADSGSPATAQFLNTQFTGPAVTIDSAATNVGPVVLHQSSTFGGTIIGTDGKAIPGVTIELTKIPGSSVDGDTAAFTELNQGTTIYANGDASGRFSVSGLPVGTYTAQFSPEPGSAYGSQYLGGGSDATASTPISITSEGSSVYQDVRLYPGGAITGTVTNKVTGKAIAGQYIEADQESIAGDTDDGGFDNYIGDVSNSKGAYVLPGLTAGGYNVSYDDYSSNYANQNAEVYVPDKTTVKKNVSLSPLVAVSGTVTAASGPLTDVVDVQAVPVVNGVADFEAQDTCAIGCGPQYATTTDLSGKYTLMLPPGTWTLYFATESTEGADGADVYLGGSYDSTTATQFTVGTSAVAGKNVELPQYTGELSVTVAHDNGDPLSGSVQIDRIVNGEAVSFRNTQGEASNDELGNGTITFVNLPQGDYRVIVDAGTQNGDYAEYTSSDVQVNEGSTTSVPVNLTGLMANDGAEPQVVPGSEPSITVDTDLKVGDVLSANNGTWNEPVGTYFYHWMRDGKLISGATNPTYVLAPGDAGDTISLSMAAATQSGDEAFRPYQLSFTTDPTGVVALGDPANATTAPVITGAPKVGSTLSVSTGSWDLPGLTYSYAWYRNELKVATSATYKLTTADVGQGIAATVTATRTGFQQGESIAFAPNILASTAVKQTKASVVTANQDGSYTVTAGTWSPTGGTITYQWLDYAAGATTGTPISGATSATLASGDVPSDTTKVTVLVTDTKAGYATTSYEFVARNGEQTTFTGTPALNDFAAIDPGTTLSVDPTTLGTSPRNAVLTYSWRRNSNVIKGAGGPSYTITSADVGAEIDLWIVATAPGHPASAVAIAAAGQATASTSFNSTTTAITGTELVGRTLTASVSGWSPAPTSVSYQWYLGDQDTSPISKATKSTFVTTAADAGEVVTVKVTGKRTGLMTTIVTTKTAPIGTLGPQNLTAPSIPNTVIVGTKVTANVGKWDIAPTSYLYQWYLNGNAIPAATASTYTPLVTDLDNDLSVTVQPVRAGLQTSDPVQTNAVTVSIGAATTASKVPTLSVSGKPAKSVKVGQTIAATAGTWPAVALSLSYQWQYEAVGTTTWVDIDGATSKTLFIDPALDVFVAGSKLRVVVSATRTGYAAGPDADSAALPIVQ